ncbi:MAG: hypothetical protein ACLR8P_13525 [Clostridium fessum]
MGLPLDAYALVAGIYRIIDQIHTSTNSVGNYGSICLHFSDGGRTGSRDFQSGRSQKGSLSFRKRHPGFV